MMQLQGGQYEGVRGALAALTLAGALLTACGTADGSAEPDSGSGGDDRNVSADIGLLNEYTLPEVPQPEERYKVFVVQAHQTDVFAQSAASAIADYGKKLGVDVEVLDAGGYPEVQKQISQIQAATSQDPDAIVVWSTDPNAVVPALQEAADGGAKIFGWIQPPAFPGLTSTVSSDYTSDAANYSKALFDYVGGSGEVMAAFGACASQYYKDLHEGMERALADYPDIEVVADECTPDFDPSKTETLVSNTLTAHPELEGVVTSLVQQAVGAVTAAKAAGAGGQVTAVGEAIADCGQIDLLKEGDLPIIAGLPAVYFGQLMMATVVQSLEGAQVEPELIVPSNVYTRDNIDQAPLELELADEFRSGC